MNLDDLRSKINRLDQKIVSLIARRMKLAKNAGVLKKRNGLKIPDARREKEILEAVKDKADREGIDSNVTEKIWKILISEAKKIQQND